jgi:predicted GNAT family acetyltransferase
MAVEVADVPERKRYEIAVDGGPAGFTEYLLSDGLITFVHTEVDPARRGQGLAGRLIGYALDDARGRGLGVVPFCPYVRKFVTDHPDYLALVPADERQRFGL